MNKTNEVILTGTYRTEQVTPTFEKQVLTFASKDRDGQWKDGDFELYVKPELAQQSGITPGDQIKVKGFMVFNFFTKQDGTQMAFPKMIATEIQEVEKAGAAAAPQQPAPIQPTQPTGYAQGVPPMPGAAPAAPQAAPGIPPMPPAPGVPPAA
jgi:hypothetical protein